MSLFPHAGSPIPASTPATDPTFAITMLLQRIADALEAQPKNRVILVAVDGNMSAETAKQLAQAIKEGLDGDEE